MLKKGIRVRLTEDPHKNLFSEKNLHDRTSQFTNSSPTHEHTGEDPAAKHALYDNKANKSWTSAAVKSQTKSQHQKNGYQHPNC